MGLIMLSKRAKLILVAGAGWCLLLARPSSCSALPVDMGIAGPSYWTALQTGGGTISVTAPTTKTKSGKKKKLTVRGTFTPHIAIMGNVGVAQGGQIQDNGAQFEGGLYLGDNASAQFSGSYSNNSPVSGMVHMSTDQPFLRVQAIPSTIRPPLFSRC